MRFKVKPQPVSGDTRMQTKFAWLPVTIGDTNVWLESYIANEKYFEGDGRVSRQRWAEMSAQLIEHDGMW
jgi:hypothetical protein